MKTIDLHIIDIVHNSIRAKASEIGIEIVDKESENYFSVKITDNGCGMSNEMLTAINESFYSSRKERKIGLGLALLKYHAELCDGRFCVKSKVAAGTEVFAFFRRDHIDKQPNGDISGCVTNFICQYQDINFTFKYYSDNSEFEISSKEVKDVFDGIDLNNNQIILSLGDLIKEGMA